MNSRLSLVIPMHNESPVLSLLGARLHTALNLLDHYVLRRAKPLPVGVSLRVVARPRTLFSQQS